MKTVSSTLYVPQGKQGAALFSVLLVDGYVQIALKTASSTNMSAQTNHFRLEVMALQYQELLLHAILLKHLM